MFENFVWCILIIFVPSPQFLPGVPTSLLSQLHVLCVRVPLTPLCVGWLQLSLRPALECGQYTRCHSTKEQDSPPPSSSQMAAAPQLGVGLRAFPAPGWDCVWLSFCGLVHAVTLFKFTCTRPAVSGEHCFLDIIHCLWLPSLLVPFPHRPLNLEEGDVA